MRHGAKHVRALDRSLRRELERQLRRPSAAFRRRSWLQFQRALDPLAAPRATRIVRR